MYRKSSNPNASHAVFSQLTDRCCHAKPGKSPNSRRHSGDMGAPQEIGGKLRRLLLDSGGLATLSLPARCDFWSWGEPSFSLVSWLSWEIAPSHWSTRHQVGLTTQCCTASNCILCYPFYTVFITVLFFLWRCKHICFLMTIKLLPIRLLHSITQSLTIQPFLLYICLQLVMLK